MDIRTPIPAKRARGHPDHRFLRLGGIAEWSLSPAVALAQDLRCHAEARHRRVRCESDQRTASFVRGAGEPHRLGALGLQARDDDERESSAAKKLFCPTKSVLSIPRAHEDRSLFPEWTGDGAEPIDPDRSLTLGNGGVTCSPQHRCRSTLWHPDGQPSPGKTATWKNCIEYFDARSHRFRGPMGDRCRIRKSMLDEGADGGVAVGHALLEYPEHIPKATGRSQSEEGAAG